MGTRPRQLADAVASLARQRGVDLDILVVGNGWEPSGLPADVRSLHLPENVGIPEGRNVGARECRGDTIFFFDDDAVLPTDDVLARLAAALWEHPRTAVVQPRAVDPTGLPSPRRWVPRLRVGDDATGGPVVVFWEGVHATRRAAFEEVGGWPGHFFYGHEGIDLAWRLIDAGWQIRYEPSVVVNHPATSPTRHAVYYRMNARNRVWVARRNLPVPLVPVYLGVWVAITPAANPQPCRAADVVQRFLGRHRHILRRAAPHAMVLRADDGAPRASPHRVIRLSRRPSPGDWYRPLR